MCYKLNYILCPLEPVFLSPLMFPIGFNGLLNLQSFRLKISDQIRSDQSLSHVRLFATP